jgi:hypothetical protein
MACFFNSRIDRFATKLDKFTEFYKPILLMKTWLRVCRLK